MSRSLPLPAAILVVGALSLAGCSTITSSHGGGAGPRSVEKVALKGAGGAARGAVIVRVERDGANSLTVNASAFPPGLHGLHLHEKGRCEGPAFASAGGHWNPTGRKHGRDNPAGAHIGDLPNLDVGLDGSATASFTIAANYADADGTALVVHAKGDDYRTDPSGNSGDRIACAVIAPPK